MFAMAPEPLRIWLCFWTMVIVAGCSRSEPQSVQHPKSAAEPDFLPAKPTLPKVAPADEHKDRGTIEGTVRFSGQKIPASTIIPVGADRPYCGPEHSKEDCVIDAESRGIRYVIVRLQGEKLRSWPHAHPGHLFLDNKDCRFEPHAAVLTVGSTIEMFNSDKIAHTVHAYFGDSFNYLLPSREQKDARIKHIVRSPGLIMLRCDVHGWMNSFIGVDSHPFHGVTDSQGRFAIRGVPAGSYTLVSWHERFGTQQTKVTVAGGRTAQVHLKCED